MNHYEIEKTRRRVWELMKISSPSLDEKNEIEAILNMPLHPRDNGIKIALLQTHYKQKLKTETAEFYLYEDQYYFWELVYLRINELNENNILSYKDRKDLTRISRLHIRHYHFGILQHEIVKRYFNDLEVEDQISLCIDWFKRPTYKQSAILLCFRGNDKITMKSQYLREQIRLLVGNHLFKRERSCTILICHQLNAHFDSTGLQFRNTLVEALVKTMNKETERAARQLFLQKFNFIPVKLRNNILTTILNSRELPCYYVKRFLHNSYQNISEANYTLIEEKIRKYNG